MNRFLIWLDSALYRWGGPLYAGLMRAKGYHKCRMDRHGAPWHLTDHHDDCRFVPDVPGGIGWVRCAPGCSAPHEPL